MPDGFGFRGGWGFGFRGASPPWPYVGLGRGGLPRCWYFLEGAPARPGAPYAGQPYGYYGGPWPYGAGPVAAPYGAGPGVAPYGARPSREEELEYLKGEAQAIGQYLKDIEARIQQLTSEQEQSE